MYFTKKEQEILQEYSEKSMDEIIVILQQRRKECRDPPEAFVLENLLEKLAVESFSENPAATQTPKNKM